MIWKLNSLKNSDYCICCWLSFLEVVKQVRFLWSVYTFTWYLILLKQGFYSLNNLMIVINSLLQMGQLNSGLYSFLKKKVIKYGFLFSSCYTSCLLNIKLDAFISTLKGLFGSIIVNIDLLVILYLIWSKVFCCFYVYSKVLSFFVNFVKGIANCPNLSTKRRQKLVNLRNPRTFLIFVDCS